MTLLVVGSSHLSAPLETLEALAAADPQALAGEALASPHVAETLVVSTCNRVEVYAEVDRFHAAVDDVTATLAKASGVPAADLTSLIYVHYDERAAQHLFEVTGGLNSMVVGEQQILGQVRASLAAAQDSGTAGRELNEVAQAALRVGKRIRTDTGLDRAGASVVTVAYADAFEQLAARGGPQPEDAAMVVVGSGALSGLAVAHATRSGVSSLTVAGRTESRARRLAEQYDAAGAPLHDLPDLLTSADVVVCCTGAVGTVLDHDTVTAAMSRRGDRPLAVIDLALPHDTDPRIAQIPGVVRIDLAVLAERPEAHADHADTIAAHELVSAELRDYFAARAARAVEPVLVSLRARATAVVDAELRRLRERVPGLADTEWEQIEQSLRRTVNTLMHTPTVRIKELAADPDGQRYADALNSLFDLSVDLVDTVVVPRDPPEGGVS
ncbi:MAG: glutamyl-tRNA reductase [Candidatus Nanopelagicales bacterium]